MKRHVNSGIFPFVRFSLNYLKITVTAAFLVSPPVVCPYLEKYYFNSRALNWQQGDNVNYKLLSLESC